MDNEKEMKEMKQMSTKGGHHHGDHPQYIMLGIHNHSQISIRLYLILIYIFALLGYIGIFFGLFALNFKDQEFIEEFYYRPFHLLAFWGVFVFTIIEAFILILSQLATKLQAVLLGFNVISSLMTAILFNVYPEEYEVVAHYLEYAIQIFISGVNFMFVFNLLRTQPDGSNPFYKYRYLELLVVLLIILLSVFQLFFYSGLIPTDIGSERTAHFCEFVNEIMNGCFALWYACVVYLGIKKELNQCNESLKIIA
eukprot:TRINITY_DN244_c0_g1_i2.p1 TRINITY_DN244_c0_g1~~TRINITY_DN244_c0_g1_i2.p1  ORF type:complete len:287 (+),score=59.30 TRINITY_DN244_c0_g1_i2:103-861(+)